MSVGVVVLSLAVGLVFGFVLQKAGLGNYDVISNQFIFRDNTMMKFMLSAIATGAVGTLVLKAAGVITLEGMPEGFIVAGLVGGLVFGVGMAVAGTCPGTIFSGIGSGRLDYLVAGVLGFLAGGFVLAALFEPVVLMLRGAFSFGPVDLAQLMGVPSWVLVAVIVVGVLAFYVLSERRGRHGKGLGASVASCVAALVLAVGLALGLQGCASGGKEDGASVSEASADTYISVKDAAILSDLDDGMIVDTRDYVEYAAGHVAVSINVPTAQTELRLREFSHEKTIVLIGKDGSAEKSREVLLSNGFEDDKVRILDGSIEDWPSGRILEEIPAC